VDDSIGFGDIRRNMKWILLPGFDGTGILFAAFVRALPSGIEPVVVAYPADRACSADELVEIVLADLPENEPYVVVAESFSGPIAIKAAARMRRPPLAVVLCASFVQCPVPRILAAILRFLGSAVTLTRILRWLVRWYLLGDAEEEVVALFYRALEEVSPRVLTHRLSVLLEFDENIAPATLKCPLLYVRATKDRLVGARNFSIVQRRYPEVKLERIESPHLILQAQSEASVRTILLFLAGLQPQAIEPPKNSFPRAGGSWFSGAT
jgi:pimeloyl-ACP methyl ester carboxylesterase